MCFDKRAPVPGTGWGCLVCGLPNDGAIAVVCDNCLEAEAEILEVCHGHPHEGRRMALSVINEPFEHDPAKHEVMRRCIVCGCTESGACLDAAGQACAWVSDAFDVCSHCLWFAESPDTGHPDCICSLCREVIDQEEMPLRLFARAENADLESALEARFHMACAEKAGLWPVEARLPV